MLKVLQNNFLLREKPKYYTTNRFPYLLDHSGQVIASHLIKGKVPKGYFLRVHGVRGLLVVPGVYVSPEVAQPHVVALVGQDVA